jgi:hypothetical protein
MAAAWTGLTRAFTAVALGLATAPRGFKTATVRMALLAATLAFGAERTGAFLGAAAGLAAFATLALERALAAEGLVSFEDFAMLLPSGVQRCAARPLRGYHYFEQKNSGLSRSARLRAVTLCAVEPRE